MGNWNSLRRPARMNFGLFELFCIALLDLMHPNYIWTMISQESFSDLFAMEHRRHKHYALCSKGFSSKQSPSLWTTHMSFFMKYHKDKNLTSDSFPSEKIWFFVLRQVTRFHQLVRVKNKHSGCFWANIISKLLPS